MALVDSFTPTYWLKQLRVAGDDLRVLRAYPGKWQVRRSHGQHVLLSPINWKTIRKIKAHRCVSKAARCY